MSVCSPSGRLARVLVVAGAVFAAGVGAESLKVDNDHVTTWNRFVDNMYKLHERQIDGRKIDKKTITGGYANHADFFRQEEYYDAESGVLLSRIQWEREETDKIHHIEVFVHDDKGRVIRDYSGTYLPYYRNAPTQTLIFFHVYNGDLHALRSFDASGTRLFERCEGKHKGESVFLMLDEEAIDDAIYELRSGKGTMSTGIYKKCFKGLPEEAGKYLVPG